MTRLSLLPLFVLLVLASDRADAGPARSVSAGAAAEPAVLPSSIGDLAKITLLATEQSIFIPCYAFTAVSDGNTSKNWNPRVSSCFMLQKNQTVSLAAPVSFPMVTGKLRVKSVRCMSETAYGDDEIQYGASLGSIAKIEAKHRKNKQKTVTDDATITQASNNVDAARYNYDLVIDWRVNVADGAGWAPQDNQFKGCRIDYMVLNTF